MKRILPLILLATSAQLLAQTRIDGNFPFQTDPAKKYSIYVPSNYNPAAPSPLMLGLHPFNVNRWDAESWCDTLIDFAEMNDLLLVCPDGGTDGRIDDDIDTAFTSLLLDSMHIWYNIDTTRRYCMGFSWGGQTTYTYGLRHINRFCGFLPIGSAMGFTTLVSDVLDNSKDLPFYIVHGDQDAPGVRFDPIRDSLIAHDAIVNTNLLAGVGHTIDFPNRNQILTAGFMWIDSIGCQADTGSTGFLPPNEPLFELRPSLTRPGGTLVLSAPKALLGSTWYIADAHGRLLKVGELVENETLLHVPAGLAAGTYFVRVRESTALFIVR